MMEMNYSETPWILSESCPCDLHFVEYLELKQLTNKLIFHFGTGVHHHVGKNNYERGNLNEIIGITVCKEEHDAYLDFVISTPVAANFYKVWFADIYTLSARMMPTFDIVTLFHLCEGYDEPPCYDDGCRTAPRAAVRLNSAYAALNDVTLLELFLGKLAPDGKLLFYTGSDAFCDAPHQAERTISKFIHTGRMVVEETYKSLMVCSVQARQAGKIGAFQEMDISVGIKGDRS